jgi:hypothetical protein
MKRTVLLSLSLLAFVLIPGLAAAAETAPAAPAQGCNDLSFLSTAETTPAVSPAEDPLGGVVLAQGGCCPAKFQQCQNNCECGVFEFNCSPSPCQSSCICNICP